MTWHPPNKDYIIASTRFEPQLAFLLSPGSPRPRDHLRVPFNSGLGSPKCHSSGLKGLATNKQNGSYVPRGFRRYLSRCADTRWPSGHRGSSSQGTRCRANTHSLSSTHTHTFPPVHHTLFSLCTPQALPTLHRGSFPCGAAALPHTPPRPCFHPCSTAMGIISSTCAASIRRHAGACQPRRGDRHLQVIRPRSGNTAGRWVVSTAVSLPRIPLLLLLRHA